MTAAVIAALVAAVATDGAADLRIVGLVAIGAGVTLLAGALVLRRRAG